MNNLTYGCNNYDSTLENVKAGIIIRTESIHKRYGRELVAFFHNHKIFFFFQYHLIYAPATMNENQHVIRALKKSGFIETIDYVIVHEHELPTNWDFHSETCLYARSIPEISTIDWLGSIMTEQGNYVWYKNQLEDLEELVEKLLDEVGLDIKY